MYPKRSRKCDTQTRKPARENAYPTNQMTDTSPVTIPMCGHT